MQTEIFSVLGLVSSYMMFLSIFEGWTWRETGLAGSDDHVVGCRSGLMLPPPLGRGGGILGTGVVPGRGPSIQEERSTHPRGGLVAN